MRETGTVWQIGVLTWKPCTCWPFFEGFLGLLAISTRGNPVYAANSRRKRLSGGIETSRRNVTFYVQTPHKSLLVCAVPKCRKRPILDRPPLYLFPIKTSTKSVSTLSPTRISKELKKAVAVSKDKSPVLTNTLQRHKDLRKDHNDVFLPISAPTRFKRDRDFGKGR